MMISKNKIKLIRSLEVKKYRKKERLFVAEGHKTVDELLRHLPCACLIKTDRYVVPTLSLQPIAEVIDCTAEELRKVSFLTTPQDVLALFELPEPVADASLPSTELCLALDGVQDPGNMGTIIRVADWFGIKHLFCSLTTADAYSPKAVQATMGALTRVQIHYVDLEAFIRQQQSDTPIYGTLLDGNNLYEQSLENRGLLVMGNEGNGLSPEVRAMVNRKLYIPSYPPEAETSESLNVGIATAIVCAEFRKRAAF